MKFSVLMSVFKNDFPLYFRDAFESIYDSQTLKPDEIVIVFDGEVNVDIEKIIGEKQKILGEKLKLIALKKNVGLAKALNEGIKSCSYDWIARMDSDDISDEFRFEKQISYLKEHPEISLIGTWYKQFDLNMKNILMDRKVPVYHEKIVKYAKGRTPFNHVTAIYKKEDILKIGCYPDIEGRLEDWWVALRLIKNGNKLHNIPEYLVKVRGDKDFFKRRGGFSYIQFEIKNLWKMYMEKLIPFYYFLFNSIVRTSVRLIPCNFRTFIYKMIRKTN